MDRSLLLYESEGSTEPVLQINAQDLVCVGVSRPDGTTNSSSNNNGFIHRLVPEYWVPAVKVPFVLVCSPVFFVWVTIFYDNPNYFFVLLPSQFSLTGFYFIFFRFFWPIYPDSRVFSISLLQSPVICGL